ncbi:DUF2798 domain-containing protein [Methylobacterium sp. Leaf93]|uniref:DUF2798 domain-containing protein n=1 Tax=Methylobacterium sp. Leaf93 TaxID=1736249 RepID=UPI0006F3D614|nr:DUF2798 domain-containing protein [Methylobacterium sp. Leaf93]KQP06827.1 hypothetical protein ASF26_06450 [Methylobacterium sp. Leaf93]
MDHLQSFRLRGCLPPSSQWLLMHLVLSVLMTLVVSAISTYKTLGADAAFLDHWPPAWALSWVVAFPTLLLALPLVRRIVEFLFRSG